MSERDLKTGMKAAGYSLEEFWFYRHNQELIEEMREKGADQKKDRTHLRLIPGGLSEAPRSELADAAAENSSVKKAA